MTGAESSPVPGRPRKLAVIGNVIWDRIVHPEEGEVPTHGWGGISYSLEALGSVLPQGWRVLPLVKVGQDLAEAVLAYFSEIPGVETDPGILVVSEPSHRVEINYRDSARRSERLSGRISPWRWEEMESVLARVDALYVNFITGFEMELQTAQRLRNRLSIPLYADLHSLFLGVTPEGHRFPRRLERWLDWARAFDAIQLNQDEVHLLPSGPRADPLDVAAQALGPELKLIAVTLGSQGARYLAHPAFQPAPASWPSQRGRNGLGGPARSGRIPSTHVAPPGDPTGCGDVWGATFFGRLLAGDSLETAMATANRRGARNVLYRGARGLAGFLAEEPGG